MKKLYMIGGTMGVGKTTVCNYLKAALNNSVFFDGDWCWDSHPFQVTDETKVMVMDNICFLLNSFLHCSAYENVIFCWVMHEQSIIDGILSNVDTSACRIYNISLVCSEKTLIHRLNKDIDSKLRTEDVIERSMARIPMYEKLNTIKIDTDNKDVDEIAKEIIAL